MRERHKGRGRGLRGLALLIGLATVQCGWGQVLAPQDGEILIPSISPLRVEKTLYATAGGGQIGGQGHRAYVVTVSAEELKAFISRNVQADKLWIHGAIQYNPLYGDILDWILDAPEAQETVVALIPLMNLEKVRADPDLYLKAIYETLGDGTTFRRATLWIIRPKLNQVMMLSLAT